MQNSKLIQILRVFDKQEYKKFGDFLNSPFVDKNKNSIKLHSALKKYYPEFKSKLLTNENLFHKVFPNEKYDYHRIRNVISNLYRAGEKYLSYLKLENDEMTQKKNLLHELLNRKVYKQFTKELSEAFKMLDDEKIKDESYYFNLFELKNFENSYQTIKDPNTNLELIQEIFDNFFVYTMINMLKQYNLMMHEKRQNNVNYDLKLINGILSYIENNKLPEVPTLLVYAKIIQLEYYRKEEYYKELHVLKEKYKNDISFSDLYLVYVHLIGYCAYMINTLGKRSFYSDALKIHREILRDGIINKENILYPDFLNIVKVACGAKEYKWVNKFIEEYKEALPPEELDNCLNFSYGNVEYKKGNYSKAIDYFAKTNFQNFILKLQVKTLMVKLYYEMALYEQALSSIDSFKHYLHREKSITDEYKLAHSDFLKLTNELIKIKTSLDKKDLDYKLVILKESIFSIKSNTFGIKGWLKEKVSEMLIEC